MTRIRQLFASIAAAPGRAARAVVGVVRRVVDPLLPEEGTTEAAMYVGLLLLAAGFVMRGQPELALMVPGSVITFLAAAPTIVGILRKGS